jgi:tetratricopeptide (TPR) repeat protein
MFLKELTMKTVLITTCLAIALGAGSAHATEVFSDASLTSGLSSVDSKAAQNLRHCLSADTEIASSRSIRACTKAYQASIPSYELRSEILTRRGLLQFSNGKFDKAARDFTKASELSADNNLANLGNGFAALMKSETQIAKAKFRDCDDHGKLAPLAAYGLALALEQDGDMQAAEQAYQQALELRPEWEAAKENLANLKMKT